MLAHIIERVTLFHMKEKYVTDIKQLQKSISLFDYYSLLSSALPVPAGKRMWEIILIVVKIQVNGKVMVTSKIHEFQW